MQLSSSLLWHVLFCHVLVCKIKQNWIYTNSSFWIWNSLSCSFKMKSQLYYCHEFKNNEPMIYGLVNWNWNKSRILRVCFCVQETGNASFKHWLCNLLIPCLHQPKSRNQFHLIHHRFKFCVGVNRSRSSSNSLLVIIEFKKRIKRWLLPSYFQMNSNKSSSICVFQ